MFSQIGRAAIAFYYLYVLRRQYGAGIGSDVSGRICEPSADPLYDCRKLIYGLGSGDPVARMTPTSKSLNNVSLIIG